MARPKMVHPCKASEDNFGNPRHRLHAFVIEEDETFEVWPPSVDVRTICGLTVDPSDVETLGSTEEYAYVCVVCFPFKGEEKPPKVLPWNHKRPWDHGDTICVRGFSEEALCNGFNPDAPEEK